MWKQQLSWSSLIFVKKISVECESAHILCARGGHHAMMEYGTVADYEDRYILESVANMSFAAEYTDGVYPGTSPGTRSGRWRCGVSLL